MTAAFAPLASGRYLEGLLVDGDAVWFTDVVTGGIRRLGTDRVLLPERRMIAGLLANHDGRLLVAGEGGIVWVDPVDGASGTLIDGIAGANEMHPDGHGGILFGSIDLPAILRGDRPGPSTLYHLSIDLVLTALYDGLAFANGLWLNAAGDTLFFNESFAATRAFPIAIAPGGAATVGAPRTLAERDDCDGMALDRDGNVWITGFRSADLLCVAPDGREVRRIALPGTACTNLRFGGADMRDLYVNLVDPAATQALAEGRAPAAAGSTLYCTRSPVAGAPLGRTGFRLAA